jgi:hypothetical protein
VAGDKAGPLPERRYQAVNWLWLNIPLMAVFFLAMTGIPLWLVYRRPDTGPALVPAAGQPRVVQPDPDAEPEVRTRELAGAVR